MSMANQPSPPLSSLYCGVVLSSMGFIPSGGQGSMAQHPTPAPSGAVKATTLARVTAVAAAAAAVGETCFS